MHLDPQHPAVAAAAHQHPALPGVFDGVRHEVLQHAAQELAVRVEGEAAGHHGELQPLLARRRAEFQRQRLQDFVDAEGRGVRLHRARIQPRNVEQRRQDFLHGLERGINVAHELAVLRALHALDER